MYFMILTKKKKELFRKLNEILGPSSLSFPMDIGIVILIQVNSHNPNVIITYLHLENNIFKEREKIVPKMGKIIPPSSQHEHKSGLAMIS